MEGRPRRRGRARFAWLSPSIPLYFKFLGGRVPDINEEWLHTLGQSAESSTGLIVTAEDGKLAPAGHPDEHQDYPGVFDTPKR